MKKLLPCALAALLSLAASPCLAADSPWNGTWKENLAKGKLTGGSVTITAKGAAYHFASGSIEYDFACDGKPYTSAGATTVACTPTPDGGFDFIQATNSAVVSKQHRTFSADGKLMIMKTTVFSPDGTTSTSENSRQRKGPGAGLVGEWVNTKVAPAEASVIITTVTGDTIHNQFLHDRITVDAKLDGADAVVSGPTVSPGTTFAYKAVSPTKLSYTAKLNGKVMSEGTITLSADATSFTFESWLPTRPAEKTVSVYEKQ
jgi:hypothetical protein